jgi:peptidoglycan-associated lipoprotein
VRAKCQEKIRLVAAWTRQHPGEHLVLQGYLETHEIEAQVKGLAEHRTQAVRAALVAAGVSPSRIEVVTTAGTLPVCVDRSDECRELNRRVEISAIDPGRRGAELAALDPERFSRSTSGP